MVVDLTTMCDEKGDWGRSTEYSLTLFISYLKTFSRVLAFVLKLSASVVILLVNSVGYKEDYEGVQMMIVLTTKSCMA